MFDIAHIEAMQRNQEQLIKENTRLHAEKKQVIEAAEKAVKHSCEVIDKLEGRIERFNAILYHETKSVHDIVMELKEEAGKLA